jgi:glutathione S-transferase
VRVGAIVEYLLERYGDGRLAPPVASRERAKFLQWVHFAESTAFPPLGIVVWLTLYRGDAAQHAAIVEDARKRAATGLEFLEREIGEGPHLLGDDFSAADVMMGFTLLAARALGILDDRYPILERLSGAPGGAAGVTEGAGGGPDGTSLPQEAVDPVSSHSTRE